MAYHVGDGTGKDEEGEGGDHADGDGPAHLQLAGADVVEEPEQEALNESPEDSSEHHHHKEDHNLAVPHDLLNVGQYPLSRGFEVKSKEEKYDNARMRFLEILESVAIIPDKEDEDSGE